LEHSRDFFWQRNVLAHTFQGDVAKKIEAGIPVLTTMLINNHFWLLQPPDAQQPCPDAWLLKTPERPREHLSSFERSWKKLHPFSSAQFY